MDGQVPGWHSRHPHGCPVLGAHWYSKGEPHECQLTLTWPAEPPMGLQGLSVYFLITFLCGKEAPSSSPSVLAPLHPIIHGAERLSWLSHPQLWCRRSQAISMMGEERMMVRKMSSWVNRTKKASSLIYMLPGLMYKKTQWRCSWYPLEGICQSNLQRTCVLLLLR